MDITSISPALPAVASVFIALLTLAASALARIRSRRTIVQNNLERSTKLVESLPDGGAKDAVLDLIKFQARHLRDVEAEAAYVWEDARPPITDVVLGLVGYVGLATVYFNDLPGPVTLVIYLFSIASGLNAGVTLGTWIGRKRTFRTEGIREQRSPWVIFWANLRPGRSS